jgi:hypothetical protein
MCTNYVEWLKRTQSSYAIRITPQVRIIEQEFPVLATFGEYTIYPMARCTEDEVAHVFIKICQRGNPVLQGRPAADLHLLGRAMYRKSNPTGMNMGQVAMHNGEPVALAFNWDMAEGGVWKDSGFETPQSLAMHAAVGKAAFDSFKPKARGKTFFAGFFGVAPGHNGQLYGYMACSSYMIAHKLGFEDGFQFSLLATLNNRPAYGKYGTEEQNMNWHVEFADVAADNNEAVADELLEMTGMINCSLTNLNFAMEEGGEWMARAAATIKLKSAEEIRQPSQSMCSLYMEWLKHSHSSHAIKIASRL